MAEAILKAMDKTLEVYSAGLHPDPQVDPFAIKVMQEIGIDISTKKIINYLEYQGMEVDYLITLCEGTKDKIASVNVQSRHKIHLGFEEQGKTNCTEDEIITIYRNIRDEIKNELDYFYSRILKPEGSGG
jgi:arsenate reductase